MKQPDHAQRGSGNSPTNPSLIANPLDFISEDHLRERQICAVIDALATALTPDRQAILTVLRFLNEEFNVHLRDEMEDLFPLLERRCTEEDSIDRAISRIKADQDEAICLLPAVRMVLASALDTGLGFPAEGRATLVRFAGHVRRHLVAESAILLPIARARLTRADLRTLSKHMRSRRGLPEALEISHVE
jgi:hemerythrin-like domain-containing protein